MIENVAPFISTQLQCQKTMKVMPKKKCSKKTKIRIEFKMKIRTWRLEPGRDCGEKGSRKKVNLRSRYSDVQRNWVIFEGKGK